MKPAIALLSLCMLLNISSCVQKDELISVEWKEAGLLPETDGKLLGFAGPVAGVSQNVFITGGGANFPDKMPWLGGAKKYYDDLFIYKMNDRDSLLRFASAKLPFPLAYPACVSTGKGIVVAGGENDNGPSKKVLLFNWNGDEAKIDSQYLADLPVAVTSPAITSVGDILYLGGGDAGIEVSDQFLSLNLNEPEATWQRLPDLPQPTSHAVLAAQSDGQNKCIFLIGGRKKNPGNPSDLYSTVFRFDPASGVWQEMKSLDHPLSAGTGIAAGAHSILLFGGDTGETFHRTEELIFSIAKENDEVRKKELNEEKIRIQSAHPGFSKFVLQYNTLTNEWKKIGEIPFDSPVTTVAVPWNHHVIIAGGEIRAGVRTPQILSGKIND